MIDIKIFKNLEELKKYVKSNPIEIADKFIVEENVLTKEKCYSLVQYIGISEGLRYFRTINTYSNEKELKESL